MTSSWRDRRSVLSSLLEEIAGTKSARAVLISAEHFSSRFYAADVRRLASDFGNFDCEIVVVLRTHEVRAFSAYSSTIRAGRRLTADQFLDELLLPANWYVRYRETVERWEKVFGKSNTKVLLFEESGNVIETLARCGLTPGANLGSASRYFMNFEHSACTLEALRRVNERISPEDDFATPQLLRFKVTSLARARILRALAAAAPACASLGACVTADRRARLDALAAADRAWLKAEYGLEMAKTASSTISDGSAYASVQNCADSLLSRLSWEAAAWLWIAQKLKTRDS